ncbi:leucine-rich repeat-containing G-protein coupled receptor 4 isoform X2 [Condylostylus longicornis]|uniref:leucine-rich repeat-containing G-protein coupled receptor 4 isoform X2 n=1 Tax=Condylostylus longicornis TaxID=2530218 RepID=UPI00244E43F3|nr:leucine-rich repeat-containing G-protein coupled receptor 4 isoform X2 [Condylostylus longicornis]
MSSFMFTVFSIACAVRREISPCTCEPMQPLDRNLPPHGIELACEKVDSFNQIVDSLSNKFAKNDSISLLISHSNLEDLEMRAFTEMNLNLKKLRLMSNNLRTIPELPFRGLSSVEFLSFGENYLEEIPKHVLNHLPKVSTLDLGKGQIRSVNRDDLKGVPLTKYLFLVSNNITRIDKNSLPKGLVTLHLGINNISTLNGSLQGLLNLEHLFINENNLTTLDGELPPSPNLKLLLAKNNKLKSLPEELKEYVNLDRVYLDNNHLESLNRNLKTNKKLSTVNAVNNRIKYLAEDEFSEAEIMIEVDFSINNIKSLNRSLLPMVRLKTANFSFNLIEEFSMEEIRGLHVLKIFDISYNRIRKLTGSRENLIEPISFLMEFYLNNNLLKSLDGALIGLNKMKILNLAYNQIERISSDDFIGLESLEVLDLSNNQLLTLEETSTTSLPSLKYLKVQFNNITSLDKDFHGLPTLCQANFTHNQIISVSPDLVSKTRCSNHGVLGKLEIWLEDNPFMCDIEKVAELCPVMDSQGARIRGKYCYEPNEEICTDEPYILVAHPAPKLTVIRSEFLPTIAPVIIKLPLPIKEQTLRILPTSTSSTTTTTTTTILPTTSVMKTINNNSASIGLINSLNLTEHVVETTIGPVFIQNDI